MTIISLASFQELKKIGSSSPLRLEQEDIQIRVITLAIILTFILNEFFLLLFLVFINLFLMQKC